MVKLACFSSFLCNEKHIVNGNPWVQTQRGNVKPLPLTPTSPFLLSWEENRSDSRRSALTVQKPFIKPAICSLSARVEVEAADMRSPRISSINVHILQTANPPPALSTLHPLVYLDAQSLEDAGDAMSIQEAESTWQARPFQIAMTAPPFYPCSSRCPQ